MDILDRCRLYLTTGGGILVIGVVVVCHMMGVFEGVVVVIVLVVSRKEKWRNI